MAVIIWTLAALIGISLSLWGVWTAGWDLHDLYFKRLNHTRRIVAWGNLSTETFRALIFGINLSLGVGVLLFPEAIRAVTVPGLVFAAILLSINTALDRFNRHLIVDYYKQNKAV